MGPKSNPPSHCHFTTLATIILAFQVMDARSQAVPPVISRIASTTNGLALSWSGDTNAAYTVQVRPAIASGAWQNAPMRYRWPRPLTNWSDASLTLRAPRFYRVLAETLPTPERGRLLTNTTASQLS